MYGLPVFINQHKNLRGITMLKTVGNPSTRFGDQTILNGNLVIGTAGKGVDFSADPSAPGMTSELLDDYEEGTWTPTDQSGAGLAITIDHAVYTKIGRLVTVNAYVNYPANADANNAKIDLPFACPFYDIGTASATTGNVFSIISVGATNLIEFRDASLVRQTNASLSGAAILFTFSYTV